MNIHPIKTSIFKEKENLISFIVKHIPEAKDAMVLAIASKLICLWKGSYVKYESISQKENLIQKESSHALKTPLAWFTIKDGMVMTNAGIDESNVENKLLLLPSDCYKIAEEIRISLLEKWKIKKLGIVITDSMILPLRAGVIGAAIAYSGFKGVKDFRGVPDLVGKPLKVTFVNVADSLATAATLCMGEANESQPLCVLQDAPIEFVDGYDQKELKYPIEEDLYTPLFKAVGFITKGENND